MGPGRIGNLWLLLSFYVTCVVGISSQREHQITFSHSFIHESTRVKENRPGCQQIHTVLHIHIQECHKTQALYPEGAVLLWAWR